MNKIYKVMYSKVKQCAVVVSEIAKSHGHNGESSKVRKQAMLTAAVLIAMGSISFAGIPVAQADESLLNNDFIGANDYYWYYDETAKEWKTYQYKATDLLNNRSRSELPNYQGGGAKLPGAITAGLYAQAGQQTITIGDRNAGQSRGSVFIGELSGYNNGDNAPSASSLSNNYVTAVGFQSDATGWGSIAIGSNATAENTKKTDTTVEEVGDAGTSGTVADDVYGIKSKPSIEGASVALGYNAHSKDGNIAIGSYSDATTTTDKTKTAYTDKDVATSYVSVGSTKTQRRITNVADGADASDVATVGQLQQAITDTGVNNKANIDASNIGANLKQADGTTAAESTDITTNENAWGAAIGTGKVADPTKSDTNDPLANGSQQLVTGGTVYTALQQQANNLKVNAGWGINVADVTTKNDDNTETTTKNVISLNRNLGTNLDATKQVNLNAGQTGLVLGTVVTKNILTDGNDMSLNFQNFGATGDYAVTVGGEGLMATEKYSAALGGYLNKASGEASTVSGGYKNTASGQESSVSGGYWNEAKGRYSSVSGGYQNTASGENSSILGGMSNKTTTSGYHAVVVGGENNTANEKNSSIFGGKQNTANGQDASVVGGLDNVASGTSSVVAGGDNNDAIGNQSAVFGGRDNTAAGIASTAGGGIMNAAIGQQASVLGGSYNYALGIGSTSVGGLGREYDSDNSTVSYDSTVNGNYSVSIAGGSTGKDATGALAAGHQAVVTTANGTAIGYQATTDEANTIAFGHDAGDVSGYTINWKQLPNGQTNADGTTNDYTQAPESVTETTYTTAGYNRLVKVADGQKAHDTVVMEQLTPYTKSDASNIGANLKTYTVGDDGETVTETDATAEQKTANKDAWGQALGAGTLSTADAAQNSDQLITGKTLYNYDAPVAETGKTLTYVSANNTTGQNLSALDAQVAANADTLNDKTHNIKYYSVDDNAPTFGFDTYSNAGNDGAQGSGSLSAGFLTHADGIASTVAGSYSGVLNQNGNGGLDFRGAAALSYGTFNINQNTDDTKAYSGVANSIVGQANETTNSNAAIIYGAGNTVTNSYRDIDTQKMSSIIGSLSDSEALSKALQDAVPTSGGQVMVMGGGNSVDNAYMTQVVGVGNTVKGNQVQNTKGEWVTDTSNTAIKDYDKDKSSQYNYVDGFNNEVINGKHDYIIGANNTLTGDSYDDTTVLPIKRSNKSNIVIGDNHTLTREQNTVIIGSSDKANTITRARDAVIIGHNANATSDTGADNAVAIGRSATAAGGNAVTIGVNTSAGANSITIGSESSAISGSNIAIGRYARVDGYKVTNAVALGQNAKALVTDGVAIGSGSQATVKGGSVEGYDPAVGNDSEDTTATWKATKGAVSIGTADGKVTRQINGLAAGTNDTDAVNVAQLKKLNDMKANVDASNIGKNLKGTDGNAASAEEITANENAWGTAIGTGSIAANNGQLVTGGTVYNETRISAKDDNGQTKTYKYLDVNASAGKNLEALDSALQTVNTTAGAHTALTVEGGTPAGTKDDHNKDVYAGKNLLLHESTDANGKVTYDLKLAKDINIGTPGKDGEDGKIGIDGKDGHIGLNGSDGITVRGLDGKDGTPGKDGVTITGPKGADGIDGKVGISGKDGKDAVSISGKDGVGHIGLTGPAGTNGKDGTNAVDITVKNGYDDKDNGINGTNGVDGKDGITRIVYEDANGEHQVATMEDGMKFKGDDTTVISKKLNNTLDIIGGADSTKLTDSNIGVNSTTDGKLKVQLAKDLTGMNSATYTTTTGEGESATTSTTVVNGNGLTITNGPSITNNGVDAGNKTITNVGSGADASGSYTNKTNAANIGDVQNIAGNATADLTNKGLKFAANSGAEYTAKLGSTVKIQGTDKKDGHEYTADNLTTEIDDRGNITILMDKNISADKIDVNGKDGQAGVGIDGKDGISIKGKDGKDGVTIKGIDGVDGVDGAEGHIGLNGKDGMTDIFTTAGKPGLDGKDGETMTRIVYKDSKGTEHEAATLDDGLKFKGDDATVISKKLNNTMEIIGGADSKNLTDKNIGVNSDGGKLKVQLAKDLTGMNSTTYTTTTGEGESATTSTTVVNGNGLTITNGPSITNNGVDAGNKTITNVGSGVEKIVANAEAAKNLEKHLTETDSRVDKANAEIHTNAGNIAQNKQDISDIKDVLNSSGAVASADATKAAKEAAENANTVAKNITDRVNLISNNQNVTSESDLIKKDQSIGQNVTNVDTALHKEIAARIGADAAQDKRINETADNLSTLNQNVADGFTALNQADANEAAAREAGDKTLQGNIDKEASARDAADKTLQGNIDKETSAREAGDQKLLNNLKIEAKARMQADQMEAVARIAADHDLQRNIDTNKADIATNKQDIATNKADIATNKQDIATNKADIATNKQDIATNKADIATNKQDIATNKADIATNKQDIATNKADIATNKQDIATNKADIATNTDAINKEVQDRTNAVASEAAARESGDNALQNQIKNESAARQADVSRLDNRIHDVSKEVDTVGALSMAMSGLHPLDYDEGDARFQLSAAVGTYDGTEALALGGFYHFNHDSMISVGVATDLGADEHRMGANIGYTRRIGPGGHVTRPSEGTVSDIMEDIKNLEQKQAKLEQENEQLKQQLAALQK